MFPYASEICTSVLLICLVHALLICLRRRRSLKHDVNPHHDKEEVKDAGQATASHPGGFSSVITAKDCGVLNIPMLSQNTISSLNINMIHNESSKETIEKQPEIPDPQKFLESHKRLMKKKTECIFEGKKEIKYKTQLKKVYTQLYITEGDLKEVNTEHEILRIDEAFRVQQSQDTPISCNDIFNLSRRREDNRVVLTKGVAGIGKTVSVHKFILDWSEGEANQDIDCIFLLPFREINLIKTEQHSFHELLLEFHPELGNYNYTKIYENHKLAFIFDGLDESRLQLDFNGMTVRSISKKAAVDVLIANLIMGNLLPSALIWITSRPAAAHQIPSEHVSLFTEVRGFTDKQKEEYFRKRITDEDEFSRIIWHIKTSRSLHIMCHIPIFCWITATVLQNIQVQNSKKEITLTEMYIHFLLIQMNMKNQKYDSRVERDTEKLLKSNRELILKLAKLAFEQLKKENIMFYEDDLIECGIDLSQDSEYTGLCAEIFKQESVLHEKKVYSFVHLSVQEFLAALYVFYAYLNKNMDELQFLFDTNPPENVQLDFLLKKVIDKAKLSERGHLDLFLRFLLGISHETNQELLKGLLLQTEKTRKSVSKIIQHIRLMQNKDPGLFPETCINHFFCLLELKDSSLYNQIKKYFTKEDLPDRELSLSNCSTFAYLLLISGDILDEFNPKKFNTSNAGCQRLVPVVRCCRKALFACCDLSGSHCETISATLQAENSPLRELDLSDNYLIETGAKLLSEGLKSSHCKLQILRLGRCHFDQSGCAEICQSLRSISSHLKELDLSSNDMQDSGTKQLFAGMENAFGSMQILRLAWCNLTEESCESLSSVLISTPSLTELDLSNNDLQNTGVKMLSSALGNPTCRLNTLRLSGCMVTEEGCSSLASVLSSNTHLKELDLSYNHPGESRVKLLTTGPKDSFKLLLRINPNGERYIKPGIKKYACVLTFDPNTAYQYLCLSEDCRTVTCKREYQQHLDHDDRFDTNSQVLCKESLTDRSYWEVKFKDCEPLIGVTYDDIQRKGEDHTMTDVFSRLGSNSSSWSLNCAKMFYYAEHNNETSTLCRVPSNLLKIGVFLDWPGGVLSFYQMSSDTCQLTHIHTFHATFKKNLFPGFLVDSGSLFLCQPD